MSHPVVIIGGGISGLSLAYRMQQLNEPYLLLEGSATFGGNICTIQRDGFLYDVGPDSFLRAKQAGEELCRELGLEAELITPQAQGTGVQVAQDGVLHAMPEGLSLGVPKRPWPLLNTPLLSPWGKCRALLEPWIPARRGQEEESIEQFLSRRLGAEMAQRLAAPLLAGVFAGDASELSMDAAFGQMIVLEAKYGSLFSGLNGGKSPFAVLREPVVKAASPFVSLRGGLGALVAALLAALPSQRLRSAELVDRIEPRLTGGYTVYTKNEAILARSVVVAGPPWMAAPLLGPMRRELGSALAQIRGFSTATVFFALTAAQLTHELLGSGFIVPPGEGDILAATFVSSKWQGRAPQGKALVRAFIGGRRFDILNLSDAQLQAIAHRELTRFLGVLGPIEFAAVHRYIKGTPQPELGHQRRLATIKSELSELSGIYLIGSGYGAVGIPDCIVQANETAQKLSSLSKGNNLR